MKELIYIIDQHNRKVIDMIPLDVYNYNSDLYRFYENIVPSFVFGWTTSGASSSGWLKRQGYT